MKPTSATSGCCTVDERDVPFARTWTTYWPEPYQVPPGPAVTPNGASVAPAAGGIEVHGLDVDPDELTVATVPGRLERDGDPWAAIDDAPQSLEPLLALHERDRENGLLDAPWPPVYPKQPNEPPRVAPSRAKKVEPAD